MSVNIVVGLGNSEPRYALTRHNAGAIVLENLAKSCGVDSMRFDKYANAYIGRGALCGRELTFVFAEGYMNESGVSLAKTLKYLKADISQVAVIYDDITLEAGRMKLSRGGSSGGHNGVADIMAHCGNTFARAHRRGRQGRQANGFGGPRFGETSRSGFGGDKIPASRGLL